MDLCLAASQLPLAREPRLVLVQILHGSIINNYKIRTSKVRTEKEKEQERSGANGLKDDDECFCGIRYFYRACDYHSSADSDTGLSSDNKYRTFSRHTPYDDVHKKSA